MCYNVCDSWSIGCGWRDEQFFGVCGETSIAGKISSQYNMAFAIDLLGGEVSYSVVNNTVVIHGIQWDTTEGILRSEIFLDYKNYSISRQELQNILSNGDAANSPGWKPLPAEKAGGLSAEKQQELYKDYGDYEKDMGNIKYNSIKPLNDFYKQEKRRRISKLNMERNIQALKSGTLIACPQRYCKMFSICIL